MECLPGPVVKFFDNGLYLRLGEVLKAGSLGKVLSEQSVGVFVYAALIGGVGIGEVGGNSEFVGDSLMVVELGTVIEGNGPSPGSGQVFEGIYDGRYDFLAVFG
jgi:hypothetical protein